MTIEKAIHGSELTVSLIGRLDTSTAPMLEAEICEIGPETKKLILDFSGLEYVSSAGLRVILAAQKVMSAQGEMSIRNANGNILEIFAITGFSDILTIE
ncbi:MAG: STAS domain-containing protein [Clostridia bacterium]|nr:STAS domain-containing protein [Clostridia bacterium]